MQYIKLDWNLDDKLTISDIFNPKSESGPAVDNIKELLIFVVW